MEADPFDSIARSCNARSVQCHDFHNPDLARPGEKRRHCSTPCPLIRAAGTTLVNITRGAFRAMAVRSLYLAAGVDRIFITGPLCELAFRVQMGQPASRRCGGSGVAAAGRASVRRRRAALKWWREMAMSNYPSVMPRNGRGGMNRARAFRQSRAKRTPIKEVTSHEHT